MVPALQYRMYLVWVIHNTALLQLFLTCRPSVGISAESVNLQHDDHSELRNLFQLQLQPETSTAIVMQGLPNWKKNFLCHTLGRCLLATQESPPQNGDMETSIPPMTLPILPTNPELAPPPPTNPSTLNSHPSGPSRSRPAPKGGDGGSPSAASMLSKGSNKVGITAGVGASGILLLLVALLYYFKSDIFMCCKTCVRVQVFHHSHPTK